MSKKNLQGMYNGDSFGWIMESPGTHFQRSFFFFHKSQMVEFTQEILDNF